MSDIHPQKEEAAPVLFSTGQVVATLGALALLGTHHVSAVHLIARHVTGDWGDLDASDAAANVEAIDSGNRILSNYPVQGDQRVWIITEWDRSVTTVLLPEEY